MFEDGGPSGELEALGTLVEEGLESCFRVRSVLVVE